MNLEILNMEVVRALYIVSAVLFILTLGGLSNQETSRKGNIYGISAMLIAVIATFLGPQVSHSPDPLFSILVLGFLHPANHRAVFVDFPRSGREVKRGERLSIEEDSFFGAGARKNRQHKAVAYFLYHA